MVNKLYFILSFLFATHSSYSFQNLHNSDSVKVFFPKTYGEKKWKPIVGLDARRSYFKNQKVKINGLRFGAQFKGVHRFGLGFYALNDKINITNINVNKLDAKTPSNVKISVNFATLFYERVVYRTKKWEITTPLYIGNGQLKSEYLNIYGNYKSLEKKSFSVFGFSIGAKYYLLDWLAPKVSLGYRYTYNTLPEVSNALNKPFYAFGISVSPITLLKSLLNKK